MRKRPITREGWQDIPVPINRTTARGMYRMARLQGISPRELLRRLVDEGVEDLEFARWAERYEREAPEETIPWDQVKEELGL